MSERSFTKVEWGAIVVILLAIAGAIWQNGRSTGDMAALDRRVNNLESAVQTISSSIGTLTAQNAANSQLEMQRYDALGGKIDHLQQALCFVAQTNGAKVAGSCGP